jgi:putative membrane protein
MRNLLIRWFVNAVAVFIAVRFVPGIAVTPENPLLTIVLVAAVLGLVNALVRPILEFLTCPLILLTLGLFTLVINALMLLLTGWLADQVNLGFYVQGFGAAFWGALVISIVSFILSLIFKEEKRR